MLVEIEHHYGWTLHEYPGDLFEAACTATEESHWEIFTPDNHRLERGSWQERDAGSIRVVTLKRLPQFFGGSIEPGEHWFTVKFRRHFPHGTTARDRLGRRWAHVSIDGYPRESGPYRDGPKPWRAACSKWACIDDPREMMLDTPGLFADPDDIVFELDAQPAATGAELVRAQRLWHETHFLDIVSRIEAMRLTPTQAARDARCGRGEEGREVLAFKVWNLVQRLKGRDVGDNRWQVFREEKPDSADMRGELMRLAGIREIVDAERERNTYRVKARHVDLKETTT